MLKFIASLFGNKMERDLKTLRPYVKLINDEFDKLKNISDDQLRALSDDFRKEIKNYLAEINQDIEEVKKEAHETPDISEKENLYRELEKLKKERNAAMEEILEKILPRAFAVVKETARRLLEVKELRVKATDWDRKIAQKKSNVVIEGETAIWKNRWMAAGGEIEWNMVHYDVQLIGGVVLHQGKIAEMATGEGKTLVSTLPAYLNALTGAGVHIVTVNPYLAQRDSEWNAPLFEFHQISVDCIDLHEPNTDERRAAYLADITFGTNNEFGFDYLRDNMTTNPDFLVQREHHFAMVDEIDSVLIDEARTPLIISGPVPKGDEQQFHELKPRIERLVQAQKKTVNDCLVEAKKNLDNPDRKIAREAATQLFRAHRGLPRHRPLVKYLTEPGIMTEMLKIEAFYLAEKGKNMHIVDEELYFVIDEKNNQVELSEIGRELITRAGEDKDLFVLPDIGNSLLEIDQNPNLNEEGKLMAKDKLSREFADKSDRLHTIAQLLKAYTLFEKDVEYIVDEGKVKIVDEQTGRILPGRRYSDGLHQAIEAKEEVTVEAATQTFATVTLQNFFRMYHKLAGMTGTAETEAGEFFEIYKLDVVVIPTNRPIVRKDKEDLVFKTKKEKYNAIIDEIERMRVAGRPTLVGTTSVEVSELLSRLLKVRKVPHNVLNAKHHQREAEIIGEAGQPGSVTIATNMAGRGTDIKLGPGVKQAGGLAIVGSERHESRRIDRQLRGRSGRQGDPGTSQFFVSLEDDLMRLFGSERISRIMDKLGIKEGEVIQHSMITKSITKAQKKVEENNFSMRKRLLEYDDVMNSQREVVYTRRRNALFGERMAVDIDNMMHDLSQQISTENYHTFEPEAIQIATIRFMSVDPGISAKHFGELTQEQMGHKIYDSARAYFERKRHRIQEMAYNGLVHLKERHPNASLVEVPMSDGHKRIRVLVDLESAVESKGADVLIAMEKAVMLGVIDEKWKNHLREMDELRQSAQNAVFEQKDPLLVYKFESFELFQSMLKEINEQVISIICKAEIDTGKQDEVKEQVKRDDFSKLRARHDEMQRQRAEESNRVAASAGGAEEERTLSRKERREMERKQKKPNSRR